jgi:hypothetical protein
VSFLCIVNACDSHYHGEYSLIKIGGYMFLVKFEYEYYCQGWEWTWGTVLVKNVKTFEDAVKKIQATKEYSGARDFKNLTIE